MIATEAVEVGDVRVDPERHEVVIRGEPVSLPLKEFELLALLLENAGRVLTRDTLIDRVWGADYVGDTKTLDVHIKRLRSKVEADPSNPTRIVTIRGLGYKYEALPRGLSAPAGGPVRRTMEQVSDAYAAGPSGTAAARGARRARRHPVHPARPGPRPLGRRATPCSPGPGRHRSSSCRPPRRHVRRRALPAAHHRPVRGGWRR